MKQAANPHEVLLVADALTGQDAVNLARAFDERVGLTGIVLTRVDGDGRGGAALSMRAVTGKPIKLIGTGEKLDALEDFHPARIADRILGMGDIVSLVEKAAATIDAEKAARVAEKMRKGAFDLGDLREQLAQMQKMGGIGGLMGMLPGIAKMKNQIAGREPRREGAQAADGDHRLDDAARAAQPRSAEGEPQAPHRGRLRHQARGHQPAAQDASRHGRHDEGDERRQARADGRPRADDGVRRRHAEPGRDGEARREDAGRTAARTCPARRGGLPAKMPGLPPNFPGPCPASGRRCPASADFPALERRNERQSEHQKGNRMSLKIRLARAGTKKRPVYHIVIADSRAPRDGRYIERLGYFNPLMAKDNKDRLKLDLDKVKAWMAKGALPTDRVTRFLDEAGVMKRETRNNPEKAKPKKKAQERAAAAAAAGRSEAAGRSARPRRLRARSLKWPRASASRRSAPRTVCAARCG